MWANAFLTPRDHLLASRLGLGAFVRYCDDVFVFDDDAGRLRGALAALEECARVVYQMPPRPSEIGVCT